MVAQEDSILPDIEKNSPSPFTKGWKALTCKNGHDTSTPDSRYSNKRCKQCVKERPLSEEQRTAKNLSKKRYRDSERGRLLADLRNSKPEIKERKKQLAKRYRRSSKGIETRNKHLYKRFKKRLAARIIQKQYLIVKLMKDLLDATEIRY